MMSNKESERVYFYPGSANDLVPAILPELRQSINPNDYQFIYCDPAEQVETFFKQFKYRMEDPLSRKDIANMNPQYRGFIHALGIQRVYVKEFNEAENKGVKQIKIELSIELSNEQSFRSEIFFFPVTAETYLNRIHSNFFDDAQIKSLVHVTQITDQSGSDDYLFFPTTFLDLIKQHPLLDDIKFIITDNPGLYSHTVFKEVPDTVFAGWGRAGDSMVHSESARILKKDSSAKKEVPTNHSRLDKIRSKLKEFRFE